MEHPKRLYAIQSVIFNKNKWSPLNASNWLLNNNFKVVKIDETNNFLRFRQLSPMVLRQKGYTHYYNKKIGDGSIELVIAYHD